MRTIDFRLPALGADMERATLVAWLKHPGDAVHRGEALASVETDKGIIDIESYDEARLGEIVVAPDTQIPVGAVLAHLEVEGEPTAAAPPAAATVTAAPAAPAVPAALTASAAPGPERVRISPAARRRAQELGISPQALAAAAPGSVVHVEDVERLAAGAARGTPRPATPPSVTPPATTPPTAAATRGTPAADTQAAMRAAIGHAMARSKREIPHYYLAESIDFGPAREWLAAFNARAPVRERLIEAVLIVRAVALAAAGVEGFNGFFRDGRFERASSVHVGTAIALRSGGLVAPALLDADRKSLPALMRDFSELVTRVRAGHMRSTELSAPTITVTSLGEDGADALYPIINPPQVAIVGAGAIRERPWVHAGAVTVRPILLLTLGGDHRVTDGRAGSRFLRSIADRLARPEAL